MGYDTGDDASYAGSRYRPHDTRARRDSIESIVGDVHDDRGRSPRPQYRSRRDSNEAVIGFGVERDKLGLMSTSGRYRVGKKAEGEEKEFFTPPPPRKGTRDWERYEGGEV
jgi:hypothetical protein